jgi:hypothetical protein
MRWNRVVLTAFGVVLGLASASRAEETLYIRGKPAIKGLIKSESGRGIVFGKLSFPPDDILDVKYEVEPIGVRLNEYNKAFLVEKEADEPGKETKKKAKLEEAAQRYEATLKGLTNNQPSAARHLEYKVAVLRARLARMDGSDPDAVIGLLKGFKTRHPNSWQITTCMKLLAEFQLEKKQFADAEQTYRELAQSEVADEVRQEAELSAAQVSLRAGNHALAQQKLEALIAKLPKNSPFALRARVAQAECLDAAKKSPEARKVLRQLIKDTTDKTLKAVAYNALGLSYYNAGMTKEARWEFLWVDVVYNQDRAEHAKALYYLSRIFEDLNEPERAQECREALNDRQFAGLEYQQRLVREKK